MAILCHGQPLSFQLTR